MCHERTGWVQTAGGWLDGGIWKGIEWGTRDSRVGWLVDWVEGAWHGAGIEMKEGGGWGAQESAKGARMSPL